MQNKKIIEKIKDALLKATGKWKREAKSGSAKSGSAKPGSAKSKEVETKLFKTLYVLPDSLLDDAASDDDDSDTPERFYSNLHHNGIQQGGTLTAGFSFSVGNVNDPSKHISIGETKMPISSIYWFVAVPIEGTQVPVEFGAEKETNVKDFVANAIEIGNLS